MAKVMCGTTAEGDILAFDDVPVDGSRFEGRTVRAKPLPPVAEERPPSIAEGLSRIGRRGKRVKPTYADCWVVGDVANLEEVESYRIDGASVIIGLAADGETEYNIIPDEYAYPLEINDAVVNAIAHVRQTFRKRGGSMDRHAIYAVALGSLADSLRKGGVGDEVVAADLCETVRRYVTGLGIFDILLSDPRIEDVYVDAPCESNRVHITLKQMGKYNSHLRCRTNLMVDGAEVRNLINVLKRESGLSYGEANPVLETDMGGVARATVVGYPLSPNGDSVAIRKHSQVPWTLTKLIANGSMDKFSAGLLSFLVDNKSTFLVCGARGAGKSSLLSALMFEFPASQRILTIEDTMELPGEKMRSMGYKVQSMLIGDRLGGEANDRAGEAFRVSLRLGESAIVLGEVRGAEARTLYESMRVGRAGSSILGTIHGEDAKSVYERVVHDMNITPEAFMATDFLVTMGTFRERGGTRQARKLSEFVSVGSVPGEFIDMGAGTLSLSNPIARIMASTGLTEAELISEIGARGEMRQFLAEKASSQGEGLLGPEWILAANRHLHAELAAGNRDYESMVESFKAKFRRFGGAQ